MASASDLKEMRPLAIWICGRGAQCPPHLEAGEKEQMQPLKCHYANMCAYCVTLNTK